MMLSNIKLRLGLLFLVLCASAVFTFAGTPAYKPLTPLACAKVSTAIPNIRDAEFEIFNLINKERQKLGIKPLAWDDRLERLAREYSQQMADEDFFSHYDLDGKSIKDRIRTLHIRNWHKVGENLFKFSGTADYRKYAIRGWMRSQGHRENLLDFTYTNTGVGIAVAEDGTIYITQVFLA